MLISARNTYWLCFAIQPHSVDVHFSYKMSTSNCRTSKHLQNLTIEDKKRFLSSFDYIFTDCDGMERNSSV